MFTDCLSFYYIYLDFPKLSNIYIKDIAPKPTSIIASLLRTGTNITC